MVACCDRESGFGGTGEGVRQLFRILSGLHNKLRKIA